MSIKTKETRPETTKGTEVNLENHQIRMIWFLLQNNLRLSDFSASHCMVEGACSIEPSPHSHNQNVSNGQFHSIERWCVILIYMDFNSHSSERDERSFIFIYIYIYVRSWVRAARMCTPHDGLLCRCWIWINFMHSFDQNGWLIGVGFTSISFLFWTQLFGETCRNPINYIFMS